MRVVGVVVYFVDQGYCVEVDCGGAKLVEVLCLHVTDRFVARVRYSHEPRCV